VLPSQYFGQTFCFINLAADPARFDLAKQDCTDLNTVSDIICPTAIIR